MYKVSCHVRSLSPVVHCCPLILAFHFSTTITVSLQRDGENSKELRRFNVWQKCCTNERHFARVHTNAWKNKHILLHGRRNASRLIQTPRQDSVGRRRRLSSTPSRKIKHQTAFQEINDVYFYECSRREVPLEILSYKRKESFRIWVQSPICGCILVQRHKGSYQTRFAKSDACPLRRRPFGKFMLPAPCNTTAFLVTGKFDIDTCVSPYTNHVINVEEPVYNITTMPCSRLVNSYPFVQRRQRLSGRNKTLIIESLIYKGTVLNEWWFIDNDYSCKTAYKPATKSTVYRETSAPRPARNYTGHS